MSENWQQETATRLAKMFQEVPGEPFEVSLADAVNMLVQAMKAQQEFGSCDTCDENSQAAVKAWNLVSEMIEELQFAVDYGYDRSRVVRFLSRHTHAGGGKEDTQ